ncbi:hypothetical protein EVAR_92305_1 [Eumeta japonica]|uniref:Uncharacterized protein n=1 Tax=Eumeta variegata TaxID=151549 RepID=A0A4C2A7D9_EUMVA|nr:hypothetical protein EVAR_92305_1 [Eumeta japonica]
MRRPEAISYSEPTYTIIPSGKHSSPTCPWQKPLQQIKKTASQPRANRCNNVQDRQRSFNEIMGEENTSQPPTCTEVVTLDGFFMLQLIKEVPKHFDIFPEKSPNGGKIERDNDLCCF